MNVEIRLSLMFVFAVQLAFAQAEQQKKSSAPHTSPVTIEVLTKQRVFSRREPVRIRVALKNASNALVYIPKYFGSSGGGIPGFFLEATQISGARSYERCGTVGDTLPVSDRSGEEIVKEDYLLLAPGEFVGTELQDESCTIVHPGKYSIRISYSPEYWWSGKAAEYDSRVLQTPPRTVSITIELR